jgi:anti-sigma regulatory factor (Ser/Thr protein kinase)
LMMGIEPDESYTTHDRMLDADAVVLYTDGLVEYTNNFLRGEERLIELLSQWGAGGFRERTSELVNRMLGGEKAKDDIAMLSLRLSAPSAIETTIQSTPRDARRARKALERMVTSSGLRERSEDFVLAMCEAINNAVEHGCEGQRDTVAIFAECDRSGARGTVRSHAPWVVRASNEERGRGIFLMRALSDTMTIDIGERGTEVQISFVIPASKDPAEHASRCS